MTGSLSAERSPAKWNEIGTAGIGERARTSSLLFGGPCLDEDVLVLDPRRLTLTDQGLVGPIQAAEELLSRNRLNDLTSEERRESEDGRKSANGRGWT